MLLAVIVNDVDMLCSVRMILDTLVAAIVRSTDTLCIV